MGHLCLPQFCYEFSRFAMNRFSNNAFFRIMAIKYQKAHAPQSKTKLVKIYYSNENLVLKKVKGRFIRNRDYLCLGLP